jgi:predicted transcriptional regulator
MTPTDDRRDASSIKPRAMESAQALFFRDQLRSARAMALADAEGFHALFRAFEMIGQKLDGKISIGIKGYKLAISHLASLSPLAAHLPSDWPGCHTGFGPLYDEMSQARNEAVHQGAYARTLTDHAVELSIILEDALMADASCVSQFMVRNVIEVSPWHPVSYVRQQMLTHAFSYIPILYDDSWKLIPEYSLAKHLRNSWGNVRRKRFATSVSEAVEAGDIELLKAEIVGPGEPIAAILQLIGERPLLVIDSKHSDKLVGLLTASDVL